jgi:hypothetical protein
MTSSGYEHDRCPEPCGKVRYSKAKAKDASRRLREDGGEDERMMMAYPAHGCWHVGHSHRPTLRAVRGMRRQRRMRLDRYDREV